MQNIYRKKNMKKCTNKILRTVCWIHTGIKAIRICMMLRQIPLWHHRLGLTRNLKSIEMIIMIFKLLAHHTVQSKLRIKKVTPFPRIIRRRNPKPKAHFKHNGKPGQSCLASTNPVSTWEALKTRCLMLNSSIKMMAIKLLTIGSKRNLEMNSKILVTR